MYICICIYIYYIYIYVCILKPNYYGTHIGSGGGPLVGRTILYRGIYMNFLETFYA